jgi:hypothetical protein
MATIVVIPGSSINGTVPIKVLPAGVSSSAGIELTTDSAGATIAYQSAQKAFTSTGAFQNVVVPVVVPAAGGLFYVWVNVMLSGILVGVFAQGNTLTAQGVEVGQVTWS